MDARLGKNEVRKTYEKMASHYDLWSSLAEGRARQRCLDMASIRDGEYILEVAVGTGILFEKILQLNPSGINEGIDLTEAMLARARGRARQTGSSSYTLRLGDAYRLDYPDQSFDLVLNLDGAISFCGSEAHTALSESCRVTRQKLIVTVSHRAWMFPLWAASSLTELGKFSQAVYAMLEQGEWHYEHIGGL